MGSFAFDPSQLKAFDPSQLKTAAPSTPEVSFDPSQLRAFDPSQLSSAPPKAAGPQIITPEEYDTEHPKAKGPLIMSTERKPLPSSFTHETTFSEARQQAAEQVGKAVDENLPFLVGPFRLHAGIIKAGAEAVTDPVSLGIMAGTAGLGAVPGAAARTLETGLSAYFATKAGQSFIEKAPEVKEAVKSGDWQKAAELGGGALADAVISYSAANHVKSSWDRYFDSIEAHNAAAQADLKKEQEAGKASAETNFLAKKITGEEGIPVQIGGKEYTVRAGETNLPPGSVPSARKPVYDVVGPDGQVVHSGSGGQISDYLGKKNATPAGVGPIAPENLDSKYSEVVAERAEAQSAVDRRNRLLGLDKEGLLAEQEQLQRLSDKWRAAERTPTAAESGYETGPKGRQATPEEIRDAQSTHPDDPYGPELTAVNDILAGKPIGRDVIAERLLKDADVRLSDIQKQRAQTGAPGTQLPQAQRETNAAAGETTAPTTESSPANPANTETPGKPTFEARVVVPEDIQAGAQVQDKAGRTFTVKSVDGRGRVRSIDENGEERVTNLPQFARRMTAIAASTQSASSNTTAPPVTATATQPSQEFAPEQLSTTAPAETAATPAPAVQSNQAVAAPAEATAPVQPATPAAAVLPPAAIPPAPATTQGEGNALHVQKLEQAAEAAAPAPAAAPGPIVSPTPESAPAPVSQEFAPEQLSTTAPTQARTPQFPWQQTPAESGLHADEHRAEVVDAIRRGEDVPAEVRAAFPEVSEKGEVAASKTEGKGVVAPTEWSAKNRKQNPSVKSADNISPESKEVKEGDEVTFTKNGKQVTGVVTDLGTDDEGEPVARIRSGGKKAGGVPIGRVDRVPVKSLNALPAAGRSSTWKNSDAPSWWKTAFGTESIDEPWEVVRDAYVRRMETDPSFGQTMMDYAGDWADGKAEAGADRRAATQVEKPATQVEASATEQNGATVEGEQNAAATEHGEHPAPLGEVSPENGGGTSEKEPTSASAGERGKSDSGRDGEGDRGGTVAGSGVGSSEPELGVPPSGERSAAPRGRPEPATHDYRITDADAIGKGTPRQKAADNIEAIRALKVIEAEHRQATPEEQSILAKYVGWGGMPQPFAGSKYSVPREWQGVREELDALLTPEEFASARASTPNAHYTSPLVVKGMWDALNRIGIVKPGQPASTLEPSMGVGIFFGLEPKDEAANSQRVGIELDAITGRIATLLYPRADIHVNGFEKVRLPNSYFDLAIGNVPFGNYGIHDPAYKRTPLVTRSIHDYFFAKALDKVRPGGVVAFITSSFTMDKRDPAMRKYLADRADLIGAIRLPNTAFKGSAGTEVTTDIIFLRRRAPQTPAAGEAWTSLEDYTGVQKRPDGSRGPAEMQINEYYVRHPEMMLGQMGLEGSMYAEKSAALTGELTADKLAAAVARLPENSAGTVKPEDRPAFDTLASMAEAGDVKEGAYTIKDGIVMVRNGDRLEPAGFGVEQAARVKGMINIRDAVRGVFSAQLRDAPDAEVKRAQKKLSDFYDAFVSKNGPLHQQKNARAFADDPDAPLLLSLEDWDPETKKATKAAIFTQRTIDRYRPVETAATAKDALSVALNEKGRLDWVRMQELTGNTPAELQEELGSLIYNNPSGKMWETADAYLSGNVREKLAEAEAAARTDDKYVRNVDALKAIQPTDLEPHEIDGRLGSAWIPKSDVQRFVSDLLSIPRDQIRIGHAEALGSWTVELISGRQAVANVQTWGTNRFRGDELIEDALNVKNPTAYDRSGDTVTVNEKETLAAREVQQRIKDEFSRWIWSDEGRTERLQRSYNDTFNNLRLREYDGAHLTFPGMAAGLTLRKHQKNAVWRMLQSGNTLLAHVVGAGKTLEIIAGAMEMRRIGLAKKPVAVVPKNRVDGTASDWLAAYPAANILTMSSEDFTAKNRQKMMARIATGNWDGVIISYESFERLPISDDTFNAYLRKQIDLLEEYIRGAKGDKSDTKIVKELEKSKKRLEAKLRNKAEGISRDRAVNFEDLGIDALFVDEADNFKNLYFPTKMTRIAGIPNTESKRAFDMYIKTQYITEKNGGKRGVVFATGTPIANTMAEMYTMQRYLQPDWLEEHGLQHFDAWAQTFGEVRPTLETTPDATGVRVVNRFSRFVNIPELVSGFRLVADVQTADMLKLPVPKLKGGKPKVVAAPASEAQRAYLKHLAKRAEDIKNRKVRPDIDNMLNVSTDGRKAGLDMRLVDPAAPDHPGSKINLAADNIARIWRETKEKSLTQLVFLDFSRPNNPGEDRFSVSDDLKAKLLKAGIPIKEVAFIHDAETDQEKEKLFRDVNEGRVRVIIGSTQKMGVGLNVQTRLFALHHLDAPWRPRDIEQREGRILRQGNENQEVEIYTYVTEPSFDAKMWDTLKTKASFISQVMRGDITVRSAEDVSETAVNFAEISAIASGNPAIREKALVDAEVRKLDALRSRHEQIQYAVRRDSAMLPGQIEGLKRSLDAVQSDVDTVSAHEPTFTIGKKKFVGDGARKEAEDALNNVREKHAGDVGLLMAGNDNFQPFVAGSFRGLSIELFFGYSSDLQLRDGTPAMPKVRLRGKQIYTPQGEGVASIEATARMSPETRKHGIEQDIASAEKKLTDSKAIIGKPFEQDEKFQKARRRQLELEKELQTNAPDPQASAGEGDESGEDLRQAGEAAAAAVSPTSGAIASYSPSGELLPTPVAGGWWRGELPDGRPFSTDGAYAIAAMIEPASESRTIPGESVGKFFEVGNALPVEPLAWSEKKEETVVWLSDKTAFDSMYYDDIVRRFPNAKFLHSTNGANKPILVQSDGKVVAAIAPMKVAPPSAILSILSPGERGSAPALTDLIVWLDKAFGKKAKQVDYQAFGSEDEPELKSHYSYIGALKSQFGTGAGLSEVRMASPAAWRALVKMASADAVTRVTIRRAELAINRELEHGPFNIDTLIKYYSESRLQGIRDRWTEFAQQAADMTDEQLDESYNSAFNNLLQAVENKRGIPQYISQTAESLAQRQDWGSLRDLLTQTFEDASDLVAELMEPDEFDRVRDLIADDKHAAEADRIYGASIESLMAEYHSEHEGVMATALGPAGRYVPLTGVVPETKKGARRGAYFGIRRPFKRPRNERSLMATGISRLGYDTSLEALEAGLTRAVRNSSKFQAIEAMENAGLLKRYSREAPETFRFQGENYPARRIEISPPRTMLVQENGATRSVRLPAQMAVTAPWIYNEVRPILDAEHLDDNLIQKVMDPANAAAIFGPTLALIDSHNILSTLTANTPFLGATLAEKAASAPLLKRFSAALMLARQIEPLNEAAFDDLIHMAKIGALPAKYGAKTWSKKIAEQSGAEKARWWDSTPFLYGPAGIDVRARLKMYRIAKALNPGISDEELHDFINQIGTYLPGLQSSIERSLKKTGLAPFYTRGAQMIINGIHTWTGTGPMPKKGWQMRLATLITGGAIMLIATWLTVSKLMGWKPVGLLKSEVNIPADVRSSKLGHQMGWDKNGTTVIDFSLWNPLVARGARALGLLGAADTLMDGGNWWQAIEYGTAQSLSTIGQPALGPLPRSVFVGVMGVQPYLTAGRDRSGHIGPQFFPAVPPRHAGLRSFAERIGAAALSANAMESQLGQAQGFMSPDQDPGGRYLKMISDLALPGANPKVVNLYSRQQMLYQQRTGTK